MELLLLLELGMRLSKPVQVCAILYCALFLNFFLVGSITPLVPRLASRHSMSDYDRSAILSAKSFSHMAASPIVAFLSSRFPSQWIFCFGLFCIAGAYLGIALSFSVAGFVTSRAVQGLGVASIMVAGMSILVRAVPKEKRGKYTSFAYSALGHSTLISPLLSGVMYEKLGQMWTFLIPGIATFFAAIFSTIILARIPKSDPVDPSLLSFLKSAGSVLSFAPAIAALVGIFSAGVSFGCLEATLPALLTEQLDVIKTNLMWSIGPLVFTIAAPVLGILIDKFSPSKVFVSGFFLYALFYPLFSTFAKTLGGLGAVIAVSFMTESVIEVAVYPVMAQIVDERKPAATLTIAYAINEMSIQAGFAVGNILGVVMYAWEGLLGMGAVMGSWDLVVGILSIFFLNRKFNS